MRSIILISILMLFVALANSQDLIVTNSGDSINCKITKTAKDFTYFVYNKDSDTSVSLIASNQIASQEKNYFETSELSEYYIKKETFPKVRLAADIGGQFRTAKIYDELDDYLIEHYKQMKKGFHYDFQLGYFFYEQIGLELLVSGQLYSNAPKGMFTSFHEVSNKIRVDYYGLNYITRAFDSEKRNCWIFGVGLGYMNYLDRWYKNGEVTGKITAGTLGTNISIGYDLKLPDDYSMGFKLSLMGGSFKNFTLNENGYVTKEVVEDDKREGLGTIRLSVGLRWNK